VHTCTGTEALYRPGVAQRVSRGIALLFLDHGTRRVGDKRHAPAALYPRERYGMYFTGGWVGPRTVVDRCGKSRHHRDSIPGPSSPEPVAIALIVLHSNHYINDV